MELLHAEPASIWRLLIPRRHWLFADDLDDDEFVFFYRDHVYFVNQDGSVLSVAKPNHLDLGNLGTLYDLLATSDYVIDYDDNGIFDYGSILMQMGYISSVGNANEKASYLIEIVNTIDPQMMIHRYELKRVSMSYALYHAMLRCRMLNEKSDWEFEHEVKRISKIEEHVGKDLQRKH